MMAPWASVCIRSARSVASMPSFFKTLLCFSVAALPAVIVVIIFAMPVAATSSPTPTLAIVSPMAAICAAPAANVAQAAYGCNDAG